jgi:hypothetical protein
VAGRSRAVAVALHLVWLSLLGTWLYSAVVALRRPDRLPAPFLSLRGLPRTDTIGFLAFGASCLVYVAARALRPAAAPVDRARLLGTATLEGMVIYGSLGCGYIIACGVTAPWTLSWPLTHILPVPTESQFGILCFLIATLGLTAAVMIRLPRQ